MVIEMYILGPGSHNSPVSIVTRLQAGGFSNSKPNQPSVQGVTQALPQNEMGVQELRPKVKNAYSYTSTPNMPWHTQTTYFHFIMGIKVKSCIHTTE
jgi:hypothetical protein